MIGIIGRLSDFPQSWPRNRNKDMHYACMTAAREKDSKGVILAL